MLFLTHFEVTVKLHVLYHVYYYVISYNFKLLFFLILKTIEYIYWIAYFLFILKLYCKYHADFYISHLIYPFPNSAYPTYVRILCSCVPFLFLSPCLISDGFFNSKMNNYGIFYTLQFFVNLNFTILYRQQFLFYSFFNRHVETIRHGLWIIRFFYFQGKVRHFIVILSPHTTHILH